MVQSPAETCTPSVQGVLLGELYWLANPRTYVLVCLVHLIGGIVSARTVNVAADVLTETDEAVCLIG